MIMFYISRFDLKTEYQWISDYFKFYCTMNFPCYISPEPWPPYILIVRLQFGFKKITCVALSEIYCYPPFLNFLLLSNFESVSISRHVTNIIYIIALTETCLTLVLFSDFKRIIFRLSIFIFVVSTIFRVQLKACKKYIFRRWKSSLNFSMWELMTPVL